METIFARASVRAYTNDPVTDEQAERLLRAAMAAPSACNQQPWEFYVVRDPELLAEFWTVSRESYVRARASYQVSADVDKTPVSLEGVDLPGLVAAFDSRQILHVGYGDNINGTGSDGQPLRDRFLAVLREHHDDYTEVLAEHIGRHVAPFASR